MARIESLSVLASPTGMAYLKEVYGGVIENLQKGTLSSLLKNRNLSGDPEGGSIEAYRFEDSSIVPYGTARTSLSGVKLKVKPVTVLINQDMELLEEIEEKDVKLLGVEGVIQKRVQNHQKALTRLLDQTFFKTAADSAEQEYEIDPNLDFADEVEKAIVQIETTKNKFVNGVSRDGLSIVFSSKAYSKMLKFFDYVGNVSSYGAEEGNVKYFHNVRCYNSIYLPEDVDFIIMHDESVALPTRTVTSPAEKWQGSNAYYFGLFVYFGCAAIMPDLILVAKEKQVVAED